MSSSDNALHGMRTSNCMSTITIGPGRPGRVPAYGPGIHLTPLHHAHPVLHPAGRDRAREEGGGD